MFKVQEPLSYNQRQLRNLNEARLKRSGFRHNTWESVRFFLVFTGILILIGMVNAL